MTTTMTPQVTPWLIIARGEPTGKERTGDGQFGWRVQKISVRRSTYEGNGSEASVCRNHPAAWDPNKRREAASCMVFPFPLCGMSWTRAFVCCLPVTPATGSCFRASRCRFQEPWTRSSDGSYRACVVLAGTLARHCCRCFRSCCCDSGGGARCEKNK